ARRQHQPRMAIVSFDAARLVIYSVFPLVLSGELLLDGPRPRPHRRILDRDGIFERIGAGPHPTLNEVQILTRALKVGLRTEVRHVDDERVAVPVTARVAIPLADVGRQVRASVHDDVALPSLALTHVVEDRNAAGRLHDAPEAAAVGAAKF